MSAKKKAKKKALAAVTTGLHAGAVHEHDHDHHDHDHHHHDHDHDHGHDHGHDHDHDHHHDHEEVERPELPRGAGKGKILFFDAPSGLAGDMIIAALIDLGVPVDAVGDAVSQLDLEGFHLHVGTRTRSGIVATSFDVHVDDDEPQPERTWGDIRKIIAKAKLAPGIESRAIATFERLAASEARVHRMPIDDVHFHEVGGIDAIVDVVGSAAALDWLDATVVTSPLPMGHGRIKARHGILPLPPPAVVECLKGIPTYDGGLAFEFVTPTGAAIIGAHAASSAQWPSMKPELTGWGAGTADLPDRPNLLRVVLGEAVGETGKKKKGSHVVLEANIDDATGELLGHTVASLLEAGALDAWTQPITMKKGRPAHVLAAIAEQSKADDVASAMLRESTSIGVRHYDVDRVERPRRVESVKTPFGAIPVKIAGGPFGPAQRKPEVDACIAAAKVHGVPLRSVIDAAMIASATLR